MAEGVKPAPELTAEQRRELLRQILEKKAREPRVFPLSLGQDALWFLDRLEPGRPTYGFYPAMHVRGPLDVAALQHAFAEVIRRHDVFRTTFPEVDGGPVQRVVPAAEYELPMVDLRGKDQAQRELECRRLAEARPPIDLQNGPVIRAQLIRIADDDHVVTLQIHHIVFDGWSLGVLARELLVLYSAFKAGLPSPLPPLAIQFADFAAWQRKHLQGEVLSQLQDHWRKRLAGLPPLELFTDHPRPAVRSSRGSTLPLALSQELTRAVVEFSRREHFTPFMTLLAGFQELLRRYSGQDDFAIGTPTANRRQKSFEPLIGYFINVLVLRADLSHDPTFRQLVQRVRDTALDAYQHQELTLDKIVEAVQPPRDLSRHPLFQVMFVVQNNPQPTIALPGIELAPLGEMEPGRTAKFELTVPLRMTARGFEGKINFNTDLFTAATVARMADHYQMILAEALENPNLPLSKLKLLRDHEYQKIVIDWNSRRPSPSAPRLVPDRFAFQAQRAPNAVAVVDGYRSWTYGEIDEASNRLARCLQQRGVGPERTVGVCLERSGELLIVLLAIFKAGGAYVPLDPGHAGAADERVRFILDDAQLTLVVTDEANRDLLPPEHLRLFVLEREHATVAALSSEPVPHEATPETLAYIIYTSGSTGRPKGVMITHGNLENAYLGWEHEYHLETDIASHLQMASFGFDVFTGDFVRAFCSGGRLVLCSKETMLEPAALLDVLRREQIEAAEFVPVVLRNLVQHLAATTEKLDFLRLVAVGSDAWYVEDHQRALDVLGLHTRLVNSYGLTETTIDSTFFEGDVQSLPPTGIVPIGRPFPNVQLYVLDPWLRAVPVGVAGELFVGGAGVARGYWNRPDLDRERFVVDPFSSTPGARLCRTGDRVRWRTDGQLEFLGRADDQVKIRGFRIEPGEVEEVLREHPALAEAAVLARERQPGDLRLVAYITPRPGMQPSLPDLRRFLGERLPEYMVPTAFVSLESMPTTPSGKVDRRSLPEPEWERTSGAGEYVAPRTPLEQQLAVVWTEILTVPQVGVHDSFFELGGNSLMAVRLTARIRAEFQVELPLVALFTAPTLGTLAERIGELVAQGVRPSGTPIPRVSREQGVPLSSAQELFWSVIQMFPDQPIANIYAALLLKGDLDDETLRRTITEVVRRHEVLRTYFAVNADGEPRQFVLPPYEVDLAVTDLRHLPDAERMAAMRHRAHEQCSQPFRLDQPPLYRVELLRLAEREHALLTTITHIVFDGWSLHVLMREVGEIYEAFRSGLPLPLSELPVQYADYAAWERATLQGPELERLLGYWRDKLAGVTSPQLPFKRVVPPGIRHTRDDVELLMPDALRPRIERFSQEQGVTFFCLFLSVFKTLLHRTCNLDDVTVAIPVANRGRTETQRMIGVFVNTIFLRTDLSEHPTFTEVLARVRQAFAEGSAHEAMPLPRLVQELVPNCDPSRFPIVQIMFNYLQPGASQRARKRRELEIEAVPSDRDPISTRTDLALTIADARGRLRANFKFDSALFGRGDIERFSQHYMHLLEAVLEDPDRPVAELPILSSDEQRPLPVAEVLTARAIAGLATRLASSHTILPDSPTAHRADTPAVRGCEEIKLADDACTRGRVGCAHQAQAVVVGTAHPAIVSQPLRLEASAAQPQPPAPAAPAATPVDAPSAAAVDEPAPLAPVPVATARPTAARHRRWLAPLRAKGDRLPLYCIHGLGGHIAGFLSLAKQLHEGRPVYGLQAQGLDGTVPPHQRLDEMATCYLQEIREFQPQGPYLISGWSLGGLIALDVARQLQEAGASVPLLVMYDTYLRVSNRDVPEMSHASLLLRIASRLHLPLGQLQALAPQQQWDWIAERAAQSAGVGVEEIRRLAETCRAHMAAVARFQPQTYTGSVLLFRAEQSRQDLDPSWAEICPRLRVAKVPGDHYTILQEPHVDVLAARLDAELAAAQLADRPRELRR